MQHAFNTAVKAGVVAAVLCGLAAAPSIAGSKAASVSNAQVPCDIHPCKAALGTSLLSRKPTLARAQDAKPCQERPC